MKKKSNVNNNVPKTFPKLSVFIVPEDSSAFYAPDEYMPK